MRHPVAMLATAALLRYLFTILCITKCLLYLFILKMGGAVGGSGLKWVDSGFRGGGKGEGLMSQTGKIKVWDIREKWSGLSG